MHIPPYENDNQPIVDVDNETVPLNYFNIVKLKKGERFTYRLGEFESCIVPVTGSVDVRCGEQQFEAIGGRGEDVWDGEPEGVYIPTNRQAELLCVSDAVESFVAGARYDKSLHPFAVRGDEIDLVQYGSDDTKTHRKIKHILGQKQHGQVGRLLVSELYTVGAGGWSGFPSHKHDSDRQPEETRHDETYNFRFRPGKGSGLQMLQRESGEVGEAFHVVNGSTFCINRGYHPCCVFPGYEMYYFTILGGLTQRPLIQYFQPEHAEQIETIPGIKDMIAKFK